MPKKPRLPAVVLLEDEPVQSYHVDNLGLLPFAEVIAGVAMSTRGPITVGVFGKWGEGKTSVLRQAKALVEEQRPDAVTVWFNAWQFEHESTPIVPLALLISEAAKEKVSGTQLPRAKAHFLEVCAEGLEALARAAVDLASGTTLKVGLPGAGARGSSLAMTHSPTPPGSESHADS
jgi:hypothetical protein